MAQEHESLNVGQLGEILHLDAGTLTPLLKNNVRTYRLRCLQRNHH
jgi:hypothetical protein